MDKEDQIKTKKKKRSTAKGKFHRIFRRLNELIDQGEETTVLKEVLSDLEISYKELDERNDEYIESLSDDEKVTELSSDMDTIYKELCGAKSLMAKERDRHQKTEIKPKDVSTSIRVKKLDAHTFDGGVRSYPSFRRDFETHMTSTFGKDAFALKRCLSGEALQTVIGVDDDYDEMFRRLDIKYGRPEKITDAVLNEIKKLKRVPDDEPGKMISFVETIERCWLDLKRMNLETEMNTATMISQIEKLLPNVQKREWALRKQRIKSTDSKQCFKIFMDVMLEEKCALEYMEADLRDSGATAYKHKVHTSVASANYENEDLQARSDVINCLKTQMQENRNMLQQVVEGLAQVAQVVTGARDSQTNTGNRRKKCWYHDTDAHDIGNCTSFSQLDNQNKISLLKRNGACFTCLRPGHISSKCFNKRPCEILNEFQQKCGRNHHPFLHAALADGISFHNSIEMINSGERNNAVLLMISRIPCKSTHITTLWDPGANMTLITHRKAKEIGLKGRDVSLSVTKVGNVTEIINSQEYVVPLTDLNGDTWNIRAYGMNEVTAELGSVDVSQVVKLFHGIQETDIKRPTGRVDLLVGTDCCMLLPNKVQELRNLQLMKNQFGYCLRGNHELLSIPVNSCHNVIQIHFASSQLAEINYANVTYSKHIKGCLDQFFDIESLGTHCVPKCGGCKCGKCPVGSKNYTIEEEREMKLIEEGLHYNRKIRRWIAKYPWKRDPTELPNNFVAAKARLKSTEKRLSRMGQYYAHANDEQIKDMMKRGVTKIMSNEELQSYKGPVHYLPHHEILKPDSKTTPIRIVFNSSSCFMGHVLNDYWAKGPNVINDLLGILLRFRQNSIALAGDVSKMYNAIAIAEIDQQTHRFLWRNLDSSKDPEHYVLQSVTFGDRPSGIIAILALRKTAEMFSDIHPDAAEMIKHNSYVDDILNSVETIAEARQIASGAEKILSQGGFVIKHWIMSRVQNVDTVSELNILDSNEEKVLGMIWDTKQDTFRYKVKLNFSPKCNKLQKTENLTKDQISSSLPVNLTRRMVLSQVASVYDPLGLVSPYVLEAKALMRSMCINDKMTLQRGDMWDSPVTEELRDNWLNFFSRLFEIEDIEFKRCLKPNGAIGEPMLIIFSDGSNIAYGTCAYIRWNLGYDKFKANLICAKNRIAPTKQLSIPRLELCGAVLASRLREKLQREMNFKFTKVVHIVDSMIVRAQIQKESYGFGTFVATRVAEIQSKTEPNEWWWASGDKNPADLTTKIKQSTKLGKESTWQNGPKYLELPFELWPISQDCNVDGSQLPDRIGVVMSAISNKPETRHCKNFEDIQLKSFSSLGKLIKVTSIVLAITASKTFKKQKDSLSAKGLLDAEIEWTRYVQSDLPSDWKNKFKRLGADINEDGLIVVGTRMADWIKFTWNQCEFILLPAKNPFTRLLVKSEHEKNHAGVETTLSKIRGKYWIPGARKLIKCIKMKCVICRKLEKLKVSQRMGQLPLERLRPSPAFYYCAVDLFGPFVIKDSVKKRTHSKAYGVIFNCLTSRAVYIDVADGYGYDSFMMVLRRFVSLHGYPRKMRSDAGSQLAAAKNEISKTVGHWDWGTLQSFGVNCGMEWELTKSADAPWENGCSEALIKSAKRCILCAIGSSILTFSELQTVLFEVENCLNERPIGSKTNNPNDGSYLCPNDLLLGRSTSKVPPGTYSAGECFRVRWKFIQQIVDAF